MLCNHTVPKFLQIYLVFSKWDSWLSSILLPGNWLEMQILQPYHRFVVVVQLLSCVRFFAIQWTPASQDSIFSPSPRVCSNSCPWSHWYYPALASSVAPFSSCTQSLPASKSFPMSQLFTWGGQSTGVSALASFLPKNTQDRSPIVLSKSLKP